MDKHTIDNLIKIGKNYFGESFSFNPKNNIFRSSSNFQSKAINIRKNERIPIKVINWFDDIWVYIEIKFIPTPDKKAFPNTFFSLSIFQGGDDDDEKTQLFRAEWDNYNEKKNSHSQPHWHIYPHKYKIKVHQDFEDFLELTEQDEDFLSYKENDKNLVEINKFHFAMNGQWSENNSEFHSISEEKDLINWFGGLLNHIKMELKYIKEQ
ncbi:MAG: hypothetical protein CR986_10595 [Ignavibacteriae bacterium]|nr:MAG: hypothetical protein CR986_10595 [Ignavibacteriota bacterium]